jgi:hypothetical protein
MTIQTRSKIDEALKNFLAGTISLDAFQKLYVPESIDIEESNDKETIDLVYLIDGILAEGVGRWDEEELREELAKAVRSFAPAPFVGY